MTDTIAQQQQTLDDDNAALRSDQATLLLGQKALADSIDKVGDNMGDLTIVAREIEEDNRKETVKQQKRTRWFIYPILIGIISLVTTSYLNFSVIRQSRSASFIVADCTTPPGESPDVPGDCYKRNQAAQEKAIADILKRIDDDIQRHADQIECNLSPKSCKPGFTPQTR